MPFVNDMAYLGNAISDNIAETPEGFLICRDVPISRTGEQSYTGEEIDEEPGKLYKLYRLPEDVFDPVSLASLEGKPVTDDHPYQEKGGSVTPQNYRRLAKGHIQNVRQQDDKVIADMVITDPGMIKQVRSSAKREVSVGYRFNMQPHSDGHRQTDIVCNHVAIVERGRAGPTVRIYDSAKNIKKRSYFPMSANQTKAAMLLSFARSEDTTPEAFARALTGMDAAPVVEDTSKTLIQAMQAGFDKMTAALSGKKAKKAADADPEAPEKKADDEDEDDETKKRLKAAEDSITKLTAALDAAKRGNDAESDLEKMLDEDGDKKAADADDDEDEEKSKKAADAALRSVVLALKPAIAGLPEKHQKAVKDSLRPLLKGVSSGENGYQQVQDAISASKKAADAAGKPEPIDMKKLAADIAKEWEPK